MEIPLLATGFLPKEVDIYHFFHFLLAFLLLFGRLQTGVVVNAVYIYIFAEGILVVLAKEVPFELVLLVSHLKSSIRERSYYLMLQQKDQPKRLWRQIGLNQEPSQRSMVLLQNSSHLRNEIIASSSISVISRSADSFDLEHNHITNSIIERLPKDTVINDKVHSKTDEFFRTLDMLNVDIREIDQSEHIMVPQQESRFEKVVPSLSQNDQNEMRDAVLSSYNYEFSQQPYSVTPLVYSKNSRKGEEIRFNPGNAKLVIVKMKLYEVKQLLTKLHRELVLMTERIQSQHEAFREEFSRKYFELEREYSVRLQESKFHQRQEYEQLRYEYEFLKSKEEAMKSPVKSMFYTNNRLDESLREIDSHRNRGKSGEIAAQQPNSEYEELRQKVRYFEEQNRRLAEESNEFKSKIEEIQAKTYEVRQSNDKLYEYIFDLEQKIAFHNEEIPKIKHEVELEVRKQLQLEKNLQASTLSKLSEQTKLLNLQNIRLKEALDETRYIQESLKSYERQIIELKEKMRLGEIDRETMKRIMEDKQKEIHQKNSEIRKLQYEIDSLNQEKERNAKIKEQRGRQLQRKQSFKQTSRIRQVESRVKEDRKYIQSLQVEKMVLQKENVQLKATIEYFNKSSGNQSPVTTQYYPSRHYSTYSTPEQAQNFNIQEYQPHPQQLQMQMKQQQLFQMQNYLEAEARKLQNKQRLMEYEYQRVQQIKHKDPYKDVYKEVYKEPQPRSYEYIPNDDYGMKGVSINPAKNFTTTTQNTTTRRNHFCSSEAQAIIQKVKMRQKLKQNCQCEEPRNCRCDIKSKGSRGSQDSKDYWKMHHYRPTNYSPANPSGQYFKRQDKNSKMKLIQEKVRRLKSELKNSLSAMKD